MIVTLENKAYMVSWHHRYPKQRKIDERDIDRGGTSCVLWELQKGQRITVADVHLTRYYKDMFSKEAGRKYSLAAILKEMKFSREERKIFWETYFQRKEILVGV